MPNCFALTRKGCNEPESLIAVDEAICAHLGVEIHPVNYVDGWYDSVGFMLAMGRNWQQIREAGFSGKNLPKIIDFLEANYISSAWAEIGR